MFGSEVALDLFIVHVIVMAIMISSKTSHLGDIFSTRFSILGLYLHDVQTFSFSFFLFSVGEDHFLLTCTIDSTRAWNMSNVLS